MSFRTLHFSKAAKQIEAAESIIELARLEAEELEGGEHRPSLISDFESRARALAGIVGITDDEHLHVLDILDPVKDKSIILAAIEGDSRDDDDTGPGEIREGGESPSEAADLPIATAPTPQRPAAAHRRNGGRLVRSRRHDGRVATSRLPIKRSE